MLTPLEAMAYGGPYSTSFVLDDSALFMNIGTTGSTPREVLKNLDKYNTAIARDPRLTFSTQEMRNTIAQGFGAQVTKLKASGCELVVFFGVTSATGVLFRTAAALSYKPTWMITSVGSEPTIVGNIVGSAAAAKAALNGVYTPSFLTPITDVDNPYVSQMKTLAEAAGLPWNFYTYYGINTAYVLAQAIKSAGPNLTRKGLIKAMQTNGRNFKSAASVPFVSTATSHQGLTGYWMGKYDSDGVLVRQGKANQVILAGNASTGTAKAATYKQPAPTRKLLP